MSARFASRVPAPPLSEHVELFWHWEATTPPSQRQERVLPSATTELVIRLRGAADGVVAGAHSRPFILDQSEQDLLVGIHFKPGGAFPFLGVPASELRDLHVSLEQLWGRAQARELRERLLEARSPKERFEILERALLERLARSSARHPGVEFALRALRGPDSMTASAAAERAGLSQRRFIQLFSSQVGLTPKLYQRVSRFQRVIRAIHGQDEVNWADVAAAGGYCDQAHLVHDFRELSDLTPGAYLRARTEHLGHVPL